MKLLPRLSCSFLVAMDLNGDGIPDLMYSGLGELNVSFGNGDGTFQLGTTYLGGNPDGNSGSYMTVGDFNGDGVPDAVIDAAEGLWLFAGHPDGTFSPGVLAVPLPGAPYGAYPISSYDLDGDGNLDIVVAFPIQDLGWDVIYGNGDGTFQPPVNYPSPRASDHLQVGALSVRGPAGVVLEINESGDSVVFQASGRSFLPPVYNHIGLDVFKLADMNNDGLTDIVDGDGFVGFGAGNGRFPKSIVYPVENSGYTEKDVEVGPLRRAGLLDIVAISEFATSVLLNKGNGSFQDGNWTSGLLWRVMAIRRRVEFRGCCS